MYNPNFIPSFLNYFFHPDLQRRQNNVWLGPFIITWSAHRWRFRQKRRGWKIIPQL